MGAPGGEPAGAATQAPAPTSRPGPAPSAGGGYRPEIDGLRAIAVVAVVAYHAELPGFGGGFVGVDVFFVISGYLITRLLAREVEDRGRLHVGAFYGRRARRLLPVAALVSIVTVGVGWFVLSPLAHHELSADALATSTYTINLRLAAQQLDYLRSTAGPSVFRQFWSLAVEEQFYLLWPLVLLVALRGRSRRRALLVVAGVVAASFVLAVRWTVTSPAWAFYSLPTRAWQLALGALLALAGPALDRWGHLGLRRWAQAAGLAAVVASVVLVGPSTPWPSWWTLVPTLATVAVLAGPAGAAKGPRGVAAGLSWRPLRWVGERSYSWYLWHWPAMVLLAAALDRPLGGPPAVVAGVATLGLAALTYRWVEQPVRRDPRLVASPRLSVGLGLAVTAALAALFLGLLSIPETVVGPGANAAALAQQAVDAQRLDDAALVRLVPANLTPPLATVDLDAPTSYADGCHLDLQAVAPRVCHYGDIDAGAVVVLLGDSHAAQWLPALDRLGREHGFAVVSFTKSGCPAARLTVRDVQLGCDYSECDDWREAAIRLVPGLDPDLVILTNTTRYAVDDDGAPPSDDAWRSAVAATLTDLDGVAPLVWLGDTPPPRGMVPDCVAEHLRSVDRCTLARVDLDPVARHRDDVTAEAASDAGVPFAPAVDLVCGRRACPVIVGNQLVYRDNSHVTTDYSRGVADRLAALIQRVQPDATVLTADAPGTDGTDGTGGTDAGGG